MMFVWDDSWNLNDEFGMDLTRHEWRLVNEYSVVMKYTSTFVICEGWMEWIQYGIQVRMDCKGWHDIYTYVC